VATPGQVEETVPIEPDVADRPMPPLPRGKTWKLIWSEEFDGQNLDLTKWTIRTGPRRDGFWSEEAVSLDGKGRLIIKTYEEQGKYFSGAIQTKDKFEFTYGYVEARCRLPTEEGHWAAFWLQSPTLNRRSNGPESGAEIDIFEYHARWGNELMHAIHWDGYRKAMSQRTEISGLADGFHTFGLEWAAGGYVFYVDARPVWRTTKGVTNGREYIVLSEEIGKWAGQIEKAKLPDYFEVDYVRVYQSAQTESEQQTQ
jgi:beta-glucanase (GH16 family)